MGDTSSRKQFVFFWRYSTLESRIFVLVRRCQRSFQRMCLRFWWSIMELLQLQRQKMICILYWNYIWQGIRKACLVKIQASFFYWYSGLNLALRLTNSNKTFFFIGEPILCLARSTFENSPIHQTMIRWGQGMGIFLEQSLTSADNRPTLQSQNPCWYALLFHQDKW